MNWDITKIASVVLCAMGSGIAFSALGYTPVLGYVIAGLLLGPSIIGVIQDVNAVALCSDMGIIFLMFVIGQGLSIEKLKNMWKTSVSITVVSTLGTYAIMLFVGWFRGMSQEMILLSTFCVSLSSTAVTVKSLGSVKEAGELVESNTFGILIAQDLIALLMVIVINFLSKGNGDSVGYSSTRLIALIVFVVGAVLYFVHFRSRVHKFTNFIKNNREILSITILGICLASSVFAKLIGFSEAFGAFIAGLTLGNSSLKDEVKSISEPIEEIMLMTFFLGVGLQVDLSYIYRKLSDILPALLYVAIGKTALNIALLRMFRFSAPDSFIISVLLSHIGEFSFMLASEACEAGLIERESDDFKFLISLTALSLFFSPFWLTIAERCRRFATPAMDSSTWRLLSVVMAKERRTLGGFCNMAKKVSILAYRLIKQKVTGVNYKKINDQ